MVSGLELIDKPEENKYEWFTLRKHRTDAVHDRLKEEAQTYKEIDSLDELTKEQWEFFADTVSENVWWHGKRFRKCCRGTSSPAATRRKNARSSSHSERLRTGTESGCYDWLPASRS